jgi:hypothetical protein
MIEIAWGIRSEDGRVVGVDQVESGLACGCVCPGCHKPLVAAKGEINQHHFRHYSEDSSACGGGQETALHRLAKTMVAEAAAISIPGGIRDIVSADLEPWMDGIRPDVLLHTPEGDIAVEIAVNHWTEKEKVATFVQRNLAAMEIHLSHYRGVVMSAEELQGIVLTHARRQWLKVKPAEPRLASVQYRKWVPESASWVPIRPLVRSDDIPVPSWRVAEMEDRAARKTAGEPFLHYCHCGEWGAFGYGVSLLKDKP